MRTELHPSYVLHRRRYRETSLLLECLSAEHGRVGVVARGALGRRARQPIQTFQKCQIAYSGRSDLRTLVSFEPVGPPLNLVGERLYSGFYINELVVRVTARHDPNPELFTLYEQTLEALAHPSAVVEVSLRYFEKALLDTCGYGLQLVANAETGEPIDANARYCYVRDEGPVALPSSVAGVEVRGGTLLALAGERELGNNDLAEAKALMRFALKPYLGDKPLASRELFRDAKATPANES